MAFTKIDKDGSGYLDKNETAAALQASNVQVKPQVLEALFKKFDVHKKGQLTFDGYIMLCGFVGTVMNIFRAIDTDKDGKITLDVYEFMQWCSYLK